MTERQEVLRSHSTEEEKEMNTREKEMNTKREREMNTKRERERERECKDGEKGETYQ